MLCYFSAVLTIPLDPGPYTFFIDTIGSAVSLTSIGFILKFYFAVPPLHRTCIHGLSGLLLVCLVLVVIRAYFVSLMVNLFHDPTQRFVDEYPVLSCTLFSGRITYVPALFALLTLVLSRLGLLLFTMSFQSLNHERIVQVCAGLTLGIAIMDLTLSSTTSYFNYCSNMKRFARRNKLNLSSKVPNANNMFGSPMPVISFFILAVESTYQVISNYRVYKKNKVNVLPTISLLPKPKAILRLTTLGIIRPAPSSNPNSHQTSRTRRQSYPMQGTRLANFRRLSYDGSCANFTGGKVQRPNKSLQVNGWTGQPPNLGSSGGCREPQQRPQISGNQVQPEGRTRCKTFTLTMTFIQCVFMILTIMQNHDETCDSLSRKVFDVTFNAFIRFVKYCMPVYWIYQSEIILDFTLVKSKYLIVRFLSLRFWPMSVQNFANMLH